MFHEPPSLEVRITQLAAISFAKPVYKDFVKAMNLKGTEYVLDFGSGAGGPASYIAKKLQSSGGKLTCVDISQKWMECIKKRLAGYKNVDFKLGHISSTDIKENFYDVICIHFVIHDIPSEERNEIVQQLIRKLKPGGIVFMREPINEIGIEELIELFEKNDLQQVYMKHVNIPLQGKAVEVKFNKRNLNN